MDTLCDVDGTLADNSHRVHFVRSKPKNWAAYQALAHLDTPIMPVVELVRSLALAQNLIILVSGRGEQERPVTMECLGRHKIPWWKLYMRAEGDFRPDD